MQDDWLIVQQVQAGHREAYAGLVDKYKDKVYSFLYRMTGQVQDAQDLTQEVFLKAYCQLGKYKPTDAFLAWLYRMASNLCIDVWRKNKRYIKAPLEETMLVERETPERAYLEKEQQDTLQRQIMILGEDYRAAFLLKYMEQLSYKEISEILHLPITTVQMRIHHAKKKLRAGITQEMSGGAANYEVLQN
ncbi:RNA polymerase sigma factor [Brevibacillus sp. NRS-1366]|uniref:RNA polymerase sigma factor n=1 Tax=Brevibacillus sp. NRS-1366 TaxID=3233899 RepID=UPI003D196BC5